MSKLSIISVLASFLILGWEGFVISKIWNWLISPHFGILTISWTIGLAFAFILAIPNMKLKNPEYTDREYLEGILGHAGVLLVILGICFAIKELFI